MLYLFSVVVFFSLSSTTVYAQSIVISEVRANCIKQVTGLDAYINGRLRIYPSVHEQAIFDCVQKAEAARPTTQKSETRAIDNKNSKPQSSPPAGNAVGKPSVDADSQKAALEIRKSEPSNPDMKFIDDVENFFRNGGSVDVVTFVPLLQKAKQEAGEPQITNKTAVNALRTYLETNQAFKTYYAELNSRRNETIKRERVSLLATVKYAEKPFTDYIRQNLNAQNINQYLDAIKLISSANIDTPAEDLKIIISKLSSLNSELMKFTSQQSQKFTQKIVDINDGKVDNSTLSSFLPDGHYANSEADCEAFRKDPTEDVVYGLIVRGKSIGYTHAGGCDIKRFVSKATASAQIDAECGVEGKTWRTKATVVINGNKIDFGKLSGGGNPIHYFCGNFSSSNAKIIPPPENIIIVETNVIGKKVMMCSRGYCEGEVINASGIDTPSAALTVALTQASIEDLCIYEMGFKKGSSKFRKCIIDEAGKHFVSANCNSGSISFGNGQAPAFYWTITESAKRSKLDSWDKFNQLFWKKDGRYDPHEIVPVYPLNTYFLTMCPSNAKKWNVNNE